MNAILLLFAAAQAGAVLPENPVSFRQSELGGGTLSVPARGNAATVVIFTSVDCPIANRLAPTVSRIAADYRPRGVRTVLAYIEPDLTWTQVRTHQREFRLNTLAIRDPKHELAKRLGASVTPQAILIDASGHVRYLGRINDLYEEHGKTKEKSTREDLRIALDELLGGKPISRPVTQAVGCFIG